MKTLVLHIGMHKTATSTFQNSCDAKRDELLASGVTYHRDDLRTDPNHSYIRKMFEQSKDARDVILRTLDRAFARNTTERYIISGEDLSYLSIENLTLLVELARQHFDEIKAVAAIRQPLSYVHSAAQEILKEPRTDIARLFARSDVTPLYAWRFQKFFELLGHDHCSLIPFDNNTLVELCRIIGIGIELDFDENTSNRALSLWAGKMLNMTKPLGDWEELRAVTKLLIEADPSAREKFQAPIELIEHWSKQIAADSDWLRANWSAPEGFFDEPSPTVPLSYFESCSIDDFRRATAALIAARSSSAPATQLNREGVTPS